MPTTASEGFPKVIAEAINFGCIPVVSNISAIGHYVKDNVNGMYIQPISSLALKKKLEVLLRIDQSKYKALINDGKEIAEKRSLKGNCRRTTSSFSG